MGSVVDFETNAGRSCTLSLRMADVSRLGLGALSESVNPTRPEEVTMFKMIAGSLAIAGGLLLVAAPAQAHVSLSFGVEAPVYVQPPVYYEPPPVYYPAPRAYYGPPPVAYPAPAPEYYEPPSYYRPQPSYYGRRDGWREGYDRRDDQHRRWHEERREHDRHGGDKD
jgi:hypothetical protein